MKFQFPKLHITVDREDAGKLVREVISDPVCDFCYDTRVHFEVPCQPFKAGNFESDDSWAVCAPCALLIDLRAWEVLEQRVFQSWVQLGAIYPTMRDDIQRVIRGFAAYAGEPIPHNHSKK